eukprot:COSAG01_NODE_30851_length_608_cov_1.194499_1_plen_110_part_10
MWPLQCLARTFLHIRSMRLILMLILGQNIAKETLINCSRLLLVLLLLRRLRLLCLFRTLASLCGWCINLPTRPCAKCAVLPFLPFSPLPLFLYPFSLLHHNVWSEPLRGD